MPKVSAFTLGQGASATLGRWRGRRALWALPVVAALLAGTVSCGGDTGQAPADKGQRETAPAQKPSVEEPRSLEMKGLVALVAGNLTQLVVFDETTGKSKAGAWLPQYAEANVWKRNAFSPDWHAVVWTTKNGELFFGEYKHGADPNGNYGETPVRIGGKPTYSGGRLGFTQPRFGQDGKRVYFLANDEKVYSADPNSPDDLKEELALAQGAFFGDNGLSWDVTATGEVVKVKEVFPKEKREANSSDGKRTIVQSGPGWYLKEAGSSAEPKLLFEELLDYDGKPVADERMSVDVLGWF